MKLMSKDEFKEALKNAEAVAAKLDAEKIIEEKPKRRPGRPKKIEIKDKSMSAQPIKIMEEEKPKKETKKEPQKKQPVAAVRLSVKEREALQCLAEIAENHTADVLDKASALMDQADKLTNISILYREYIDTVKEMIK